MKREKIYVSICAMILTFNLTGFSKPVNAISVYNSILLSSRQAPRYIPNKNISYNNRYKLLFNLNTNENMQGLASYNGYFYVGFDLGNGQSKIVKYNSTGKKVSETQNMRINHCAEIAYQNKTGKLFVSNGGGDNATHVYEIDFNSTKIIKDYNLGILGDSALLAIDNVHNYLILHTVVSGGDKGNPTITIINLANMSKVASFKIKNEGIPQGLESDGRNIYLYTNNKTTVMDYKGRIASIYDVTEKGESEGMTLATVNGKGIMTIGFNNSDRIYYF